MKNIGKFIITALVALTCGGVCMACYSSKELKESKKNVSVIRNMGYFSQIQINGSADIQFIQGSNARTPIRIVGSKSLVDNVVLERNGDVLVIKHKPTSGKFFYSESGNLTIYITSTDLTSVNINGSGTFTAKSDIDTDNLNVQIKGSGDAFFRNILCDNVAFETRGSGDIKALSVDTRSAKINIYGSGDIDVKNIKADNTDMQVRGSGDIDAVLKNVRTTNVATYGSGDIDVRFIDCGSASAITVGSGDIELKGSLGSFKQSIKGSGEIDTRELVVGR